MTSSVERFLAFVMPVTESGCWIWTGSCDRKGYGRFTLPGHSSLAHRISFELYKSVIPFNMCLDHLCHVRCCVNPDHLQIVGHKETVTQGGSGYRLKTQSQTHCKIGHPLSEAYTFIQNSGMRRQCRICRAKTARRYRLRKKLNKERTP